jgi:hypothetical protein
MTMIIAFAVVVDTGRSRRLVRWMAWQHSEQFFCALLLMGETINNQQSTINNQQSTINNQQSTINNQQSTINNQSDGD